LTSVFSGTRIDLGWTNTSNIQTGLVLERKTGGGAYSQVATLGPGANSFADTGLTSGTTYIYHIKAMNNAVPSAWSGEVSATTP
jgi:hypothetical protein